MKLKAVFGRFALVAGVALGVGLVTGCRSQEVDVPKPKEITPEDLEKIRLRDEAEALEANKMQNEVLPAREKNLDSFRELANLADKKLLETEKLYTITETLSERWGTFSERYSVDLVDTRKCYAVEHARGSCLVFMACTVYTPSVAENNDAGLAPVKAEILSMDPMFGVRTKVNPFCNGSAKRGRSRNTKKAKGAYDSSPSRNGRSGFTDHAVRRVFGTW